MRFSINVPNFGDFSDPRKVAELARAAEAAGWDALFVWDHVVHRRHPRPFGDPWMLDRRLLAAARADAPGRPVGRRRPPDAAKARDLIGPLVDAGVTWWDERHLQDTNDIDRLAPVLRRVEQGPPAF